MLCCVSWHYSYQHLENTAIFMSKQAENCSHAEKYGIVQVTTGARGGIEVKALRYKLAGRGFDSRWCHWNFSVT
jgi:hypothetical protein